MISSLPFWFSVSMLPRDPQVSAKEHQVAGNRGMRRAQGPANLLWKVPDGKCFRLCRDISALRGEQEHGHRKCVNEWSRPGADKSLFTETFIHSKSLWPKGCCVLTPGWSCAGPWSGMSHMVGMRTETSPRISETYWPGSRVLHMPRGTPGSPAGPSTRPGACRPTTRRGSRVPARPWEGEKPTRSGEERLRPRRAGDIQAQPQRPTPLQSDPRWLKSAIAGAQL